MMPSMLREQKTNSTISTFITSMVLCSQFAWGYNININIKENSENYNYQYKKVTDVYSSQSMEKTHSANSIYNKLDYSQNEVLRSLNTFLSNLLSQQEPLGDEFAKVLFDDIFDLYQS